MRNPYQFNVLQVNVPATAPVGVWSCELQYNNEVHHCLEDIYIVFNPYCSGKLKYYRILYNIAYLQ
jgi:hypothetical protein